MSFSQREEPRAYTCNKTMQRTDEPKDYSPSWNWDKCKYIFHLTVLRPVTDLALLPGRLIQSSFFFPDLLYLLWNRLVRQKLKIPPSLSSPFIWWKECLPLYSSLYKQNDSNKTAKGPARKGLISFCLSTQNFNGDSQMGTSQST